MRRLLRTAWVWLVALSLAACALPASAPAGRALCPEPKRYTPAEETRAAAELFSLPSDSVIAAMITDYARERAELRACRDETALIARGAPS